MPDILEVKGDSLEDAIRELITQAADGSVDITLRTSGFDPRRTGPTVIRAEIGAGTPQNDRSDRDDDRPRATRDRRDESAPVDEDLPTPEVLDEDADAAADFLEGLLDAMDLPGSIAIKILDDTAVVEVIDGDSGALIGRRGQTLESIQELARCAMQRELQRRARVRIDVEGYRERRIEKILDKVDEVVDEVLDSGDEQRLEPMDVYERKAVHEYVARIEGIESRSVGREPNRRVIIEAVD